MTTTKLTRELELFEAKRIEFCKEHMDKFALIKGDQVHGFFDTDTDALEAGVACWGVTDFLIKRVGLEDEIVAMPAYTLGLHHASL